MRSTLHRFPVPITNAYFSPRLGETYTSWHLLPRSQVTDLSILRGWQGLVSQNLTELSLSKNSVGDQGCAAVAKVLGSSPSIKRLDLSSNSIGDVGGAAMAKALVAHSTLTSLSLENNCMGDHAGVGIAQALSRNNVLLSLSLKANLVHDSTGSALVVGLQSNQTLTELDVSWNDINYTNHQSLEALIQEQANRYRDASVARLNLELERLRRMEPFLAIREAELR